MQFRRIFGLKSDETEIGIASTDDGRLKVDADISGGLDSADLATQTTLAAVLAKIIAAPSTEAKQDLILAALGLIATEATAGDIKTATEALAALISAGALSVSLGELPDTAGGDMASMSADLVTIQADIATVKADIALVKASVSNAGTAYCKTDTAASDAARRFETAEKKIMNASIQVTTNSQLFGQVDGILYQIDPGDTKSLGNIDISTLYFKNATAGQNGTVTILGVEE